MLKYKIRFVILAMAAMLGACSTAPAETWRLGNDQDWKTLSDQDKFLLEVAKTKELVNTGQAKAAEQAYEKLKKDYPEIAGPDLDDFIKAEIFYSQGKFTKAYKHYEKLFRDRPESKLKPAILDRQFAIGTAYLGGQIRRILRIIKLKGYAEGVRIMEKITDRAGIDSPIGLRAALAVAENYQQRKLFEDAYLKWWEISLQLKAGPIAKRALLNMARSKHAVFNEPPVEKRPFYDAANLSTAKTYYLQFKSRYPEDARKLGLDATIKQINEQMADKQLGIAKYYHRTGKIQSANLYYDMVRKDWPETEAAETAKLLREGKIDVEESSK